MTELLPDEVSLVSATLYTSFTALTLPSACSLSLGTLVKTCHRLEFMNLPIWDTAQSTTAKRYWMWLDLTRYQKLMAQFPEHDSKVEVGRHGREVHAELANEV
jgi:hypothetical protein